MFTKDFIIISDDLSKLREFIMKIDEQLSEICKVEKIGASYLCAPDNSSLISIYIERLDFKNLFLESIDVRNNISIRIRIESENSTTLVNIASRLNKKIRDLGFHMTIFTASKI
ncbi:MAG: hypothetical protein QXV69_00695 [Sulfolobaceae archaeon]